MSVPVDPLNDDTTPGGFALAYPGFAVFPLYAMRDGKCTCIPKPGEKPCENHGKHPGVLWSKLPPGVKCIADGKCPACEEWRAPELDGFGIATGSRSGVFVIDLDGAEAIRAFYSMGEVPRTLTVRRGADRRHLYLKLPAFVVKTSAGEIGAGIDVRGEGGYAVAPGSPHKSGMRYQVADDSPVADAPQWLLDRPELRQECEESADASQPATAVEERFAKVPRAWRIAEAKAWLAKEPAAIQGAGGSTSSMRAIATAARRFALTDETMVREAVSDWNGRCQPPWDGQELQHKIDEALHKSAIPWSTSIGLQYIEKTTRPPPPPSLEQRLAEMLPLVQVPDSPPAANGAPADGVLLAGRFKFEHGGLDAPLPPIDYLVDGLIARAEVVMFVAHGNSLKTWLAFSIALALASGKPWLGRFETKRGRAAILDYESGRYEVKRRLKMLGTSDAEVGNRLLRVSYPNASLEDPEAWVELQAARSDFVVVDSFAAAMAGDSDENDKRAALMLQHAGRFAEVTGCASSFIHHVRKGTGGDRRETVRGSTALFAACDRVFSFDEPEKRDDGAILVTMRSIKDGAGRRPPKIRVELTDHGLKFVEVEGEQPEAKVESKKETRRQESEARRQAMEASKELERQRRAEAHEAERHRQDEADDEAARRIRAVWINETDRDLVDRVRRDRACGGTRAHAAIVRTRPIKS